MRAFEAFFESTYDGVVRALTIVLGDRASAEEAAQVGFERALRRWSTVGEMDRPGTWVYVVAVRHARRQRARAEALLRRSAARSPVSAPGETPEADAVSAMAFEEVLGALTERQRSVVVLRHLADLPLRDIAAALGIPEGTVKSSLHAAYGRLRVDLQAEPTDPTDDREQV